MRHPMRMTLLVLVGLLGATHPPAEARDEAMVGRVVSLLERLRDQLEFPGLTVAEAAANLKTPTRALAFVRDEIDFTPYRGSLHGAEGTLRVRVANSVDKAVLLKALLDQMSVPCNLVAAAWPQDARPHQAAGGGERPAALAELETLLERTERKPAEVRDAAALRREVVSSLQAIKSVLQGAGKSSLLEGTPTDMQPSSGPRHWAWVEAKADGSLVLDPTFPSRSSRPAGAKPFAPKPIAASIRMLGDKTELVAWKGAASQLLGLDAQILILPHDLKLASAEEPANVKKWVPALRVGASGTMGRPFVPGGETIAPTPPKRTLFGKTPGKPGQVGAKSLRLEVSFEGRPAYTRTVRRLEPGFDPHGLVALFRIGTGVSHVPVHVTAARLIDEVLDAHDLKRRAGGEKVAGRPRSDRALSGRSARVLNSLFRLQPALLSKGTRLAWSGPAVFVETISLQAEGDKLYTVARLDVWNSAYGPAAKSTRAQRAEWGLALLAVEGQLLDAASVSAQLLGAKEKLRVVPASEAGSALAHDEIAAAVLAGGGTVLSGAPGRTWAIRQSGDLLGTIAHRGTAAKGGESRSEAAGRAYAALGSAAMGAIGAPSSMLVGGIAAYLNELAKAYIDAARVLDALSKTMETGDDRHILEAIGKYETDLDRRLVRALAAGALRGWAENAMAAGIRPLLPSSGNPFGPTMGDRTLDGGLSGGLSYPKDLPIVSDVIEAALDMLMEP